MDGSCGGESGSGVIGVVRVVSKRIGVIEGVGVMTSGSVMTVKG